MCWGLEESLDAAYPHKAICLIGPLRIGALQPLMKALHERDAEFFRCLADAMQREKKFSKHERVRIKKRLLEATELVHTTSSIPTWREILHKYARDWKHSRENFRALLDECGIRYTLLNGQERLKKSAEIIARTV